MYYFLDIDGVLNKESDWIKPFTINPECADIFHKLIQKDGNPHIILSSTWRQGITNKGALANQDNFTIKLLEEHGIKIEGMTPVSNKTRQEEIEFYIRRHDIEEYVVLDDDAQLFSRPKEMNLFVTDYKHGLTETDVKHILKMKKGKNFGKRRKNRSE